MSVNITNINDLITPSAGAPSTWSNMGSTVQAPCHRFKIAGTSNCGDLAPAELYLEIDAFDPVIYQKTVKSFEIAPGKDIETYRAKDPRISFTLYGDETLHNLLQIIEAHQTITFTNIIGNQEEEVHSMVIETREDDLLLSIKITLSFKDAETVSQICCGSYYENAPFNECDGEGQTGEPNNDPDCSEYAVTIEFTEDPDELHATTVGGAVDGVETFKWYRNGVYFGEGATINLIESGVYRVDAKKGNCSHSQSYTYSAGCEGFEVEITQLVLGDGSIVLIATPNQVADIQWQQFIDDAWEDVAGEVDLLFQPETSGTYRAVGTTAVECEANSNELEVEIPTDCTDLFTIELTNEDGTPTVTINDYAGEGTPSYEWYADFGSGLELLDYTGATVPSASPGYYTVNVTIEGCTQTATLLIQCSPEGNADTDCGTNNYQEFAGDDVAAAFNVIEFVLPDPAFYSKIQIESMLQVDRQGLQMRFINGTPTEINHYTIDYPSQEIRIAAAFPLATGDTLAARKLNRL